MRVKRIITILLTLVMLICPFLTNSKLVFAAEMEGGGTSQNPYLIKTIDDFYAISSNPSANYKLMNNLDFGKVKRNPIPTFSGVLDGSGYTVKNLTILGDSTSNNTAIFGQLSSATIKNLNLDKITVTASKNNVGILAGYAENSTMEVNVSNSSVTTEGAQAGMIGTMSGGTLNNSRVKNITLNGETIIGGVVGYAIGKAAITNTHIETVSITAKTTIGAFAGATDSATMTNCSAKDIIITGTNYVGGFVGSIGNSEFLECSAANGSIESESSTGGFIGLIDGYNKNSEITKCYSTVDIVAKSSSIGGLVGFINTYSTANISQCFANNNITGSDNIGGLVGGIHNKNSITQINNSYSLSKITCTNTDSGNAAGLVSAGGSAGAVITNSYSAVTMNAKTKQGMAPNLTSSNAVNSYFDEEKEGVTTPISHARTTSEMHSKVTYTNWDFDTIWSIKEGKDYPKLKSFELIEEPSPSGKKLKVLLDIGEEIQLSVDENIDENIKMSWTSSNNEVAVVDTEGNVKALKSGDAIITVKGADGEYEESIPVLVLKGAAEYRLAVDLKVGKTVRLTIDNNTNQGSVTWFSHDTSVAAVDGNGKIEGITKGFVLIVAKDSDNNEIGHVYVRVR